ncbi:MAG: hypothetical protein HC793_01130 [Aquincola sp.]|nr:hypothetical protein [Aquincola sp.]
MAKPDEFAGCLAISFDESGRELHFHADVRGYGGHVDEEREALIDALSPLVDGPQVLEFEDFDSGSLEDAMCPSFFGPTPADGIRARLRYAADAFDSWAAHAGLSGIVRSIVEGFPVDGLLGAPGGPGVKPLPSGLLRTDLLVTVLHERERGLSLDQLELSDIHLEITQGDSIGLVKQLNEQELARHEVRYELLALGNDGTFFSELETVREEAQARHDMQPLDPA